MYQAVDPKTAKLVLVPTIDRKVDNLTNSAGSGLVAHNYWDNIPEFVRPLANGLRDMASAI
jgi:hypothetical protein